MVGKDAQSCRRDALTVRPVQISGLTLARSSFRNEGPLRFKVAGNGQLERKNRFESNFRLFCYVARCCVIATKVKAASLSILKLVIQIPERDANADGLVDIEVMKVGVCDLQIAARTKARGGRLGRGGSWPLSSCRCRPQL
jgi:hypothetical protein